MRFWQAFLNREDRIMDQMLGDGTNRQMGAWGSSLTMLDSKYPPEAMVVYKGVEVTIMEQNEASATVELHTMFDQLATPDKWAISDMRQPIALGRVGDYWLMMDLDLTITYTQSVVPTQAVEAEATPVCAGFPAARLVTSTSMGSVNFDLTTSIPLFGNADLTGKPIGELKPGMGFAVTSPPHCSPRGVTYSVSAMTSLPNGDQGPALEGWILETDDAGNYVVAPCEEGTDCGIIGEGM